VVSIFGAESKISDAKGLMARLRAFTDREKVFAQAFSPEAVVSERQLLLAYKLAEDAFAEKRNIARNLETEVLLRAAATRKIGEAIERVGAKGGRVLILTDARGEKMKRMLRAIDGKEIKAKFGGEKAAGIYGVKKLKGHSTGDLVLERMAMLGAED